MEEYKPDIKPFAIGLTKKEIRMLIWWACKGIATSKGGTYEETIPKLIKYFAKELNLQLPYKPEFNSRQKSYFRKKKL